MSRRLTGILAADVVARAADLLPVRTGSYGRRGMADLRLRPLIRFLFTTLPGVLTVFALVLVPASARGDTVTIQGCEASDMFALLAPSGKGHWEAQAMHLGRWNFAHVVDVSCDGLSCQVDAQLRSQRDSSAPKQPNPKLGPGAKATRDDGAVSALPSPNRVGTDAWDLQGYFAKEIASSISTRGFLGSDGRKHLVWVDYGRLKRAIAIRGRTEIICSPAGEFCSAETTMLVYIDYDEHLHCGEFSKHY